MSTERRRNADGGRRRAQGPGDGPRGGGRRRADGPPPEGRAGGRRRPDDEGGFWGDAPVERPRRPRPQSDQARAEGGPRRRPDAQRRRPPEGAGERPRRRPPEDGDRPRRRPEDDRPRRRPEGAAAAAAGGSAGGRRRADGPRDPRDREHGARSEGGGRGPGRGGRGGGGRGGGGRGGGGGRRRGRQEEPDDRPWIKRAWSKTWKPLLAFCGLMIIGGVAAFAILYAAAPDPDDLRERAEQEMSASQIFWAPSEEGARPEVAVTTGEVQRILVQEGELPQTVVNGVLAAEQRTFYEDGGINVMGIGRAVLSAGQSGGGSTITQQMARNYYGDLSGENRYIRKIREIFIAIKLDQNRTKDEILTTYLNTIYFGRGASGIEMAADRYFDKDLDELTDAEGAFLGIIIQLPSEFENPAEDSWTKTYLEEERWPYVQEQLALMNEADPNLGLPRDEAMALEIPERIPYEVEDDDPDPKFGYVRQAVMNEISERYAEEGVTAQDIATGGYRIETSLNPELMDAAARAFEELPPVSGFDQAELVEGLTAIDPDTGQIVAFHGGDDWTTDDDNSLIRRTQAGSSYKPYVMATALSQGIGLRTQLDGSNGREFPGLASPVYNADLGDHNPTDLIDSTANSINTSYVDLATRVNSLDDIDRMAVDLGVGEEQVETSARGPLIALGTHEVSALDQASAYATFANDGVHLPRHMITALYDGDGNEVTPDDADLLENGQRVLEPGVAADATHAMRQVVENGGGSSARLSDGRPVAGKTGTSSSAVSAWFVGYTPNLSAAVGISRSTRGPLAFEGIANSSVFGGSTSALVWKAFMEEAVGILELSPDDFPPPQYVGEDLNFAPSPSPSESPSEDASESPSEDPSPSPSDDDVCDPNNPGNGNGNGNGIPGCDDDGDCDPRDPLCEEPNPTDPPDDCPLWNPDCNDDPDPTDDPTDGDTGTGDGTGNGRQGGSNNAMVRPSRED
ncbi:transglycosylase domain-containing protein [Nocardiopsis sp. NPDC049922]|uniref:transglycosylase domain-containing protein n=1 Tax=Nocardiopsis sp. NPDC049922 TaxID=3155157 RepID=UPI0034028417